MEVGADKAPTIRRSYRCKRLRTIALDIAKSVFQVHGVDPAGQVVVCRQLKHDRMILAWHRPNQPSKRLNCIPGVVPLLAPRSSRALVIRKLSDPVATSRLGSDWSLRHPR